MTIGKRIKDTRIKLGLTQVELAQSVEISQEAISKYERSVSKSPRSDVMFRIAKTLRVTPEYLQLGTRQKPIKNTDSEIQNLLDVCNGLSTDAIAQLIAMAKSLNK